MALALSPTEPANPVDSDYASWQSDGAPFTIRIHLDVIDGIRRDLLENPETTIVGFLRGHWDQAEIPVARIEQYQRFTNDTPGPDGDVLGAYSASMALASETGPPEAGRFLLRITGETAVSLFAQVLLTAPDGTFEPAGLPLPFNGRVVDELHPIHGKGRRLVPDFDPTDLGRGLANQPRMQENPDKLHLVRKYWPFLLAVVLVGATALLSVQLTSPRSASIGVTSQPYAKLPVRPLGLYVDTSQAPWRVSWNRDATVLQGARGVRLFVRDADEQNRVDLSPGDLESGTWQYQPQGRDVTFRLEATGKDGQVAAESFRLLHTGPTAGNGESAKSPSLASSGGTAVRIPPKATHRVAAVVSAAIRSRIHGKIPIDVRVQVDSRGRVTSALPVSKQRNALEKHLATRAVRAAMDWRFAPATENGKAVSGAQTLHFVFER